MLQMIVPDASNTSAAITCGSLTFDPATRELTGDHGRTVLQRQPALVLQRLLDRPRAFVSQGDLLEAMYPNPDDEPDSSYKVLGNVVMHLRLHLRQACGDAVRIRNEARVGYALQLRTVAAECAL